jgi:acetyl esterase/lipase
VFSQQKALVAIAEGFKAECRVMAQFSTVTCSGECCRVGPPLAQPYGASAKVSRARDCASKYVGSYHPTDPLASPLFGDLKDLPPLLIQVGTDERLLDDSKQYADRAAKAGVPVELQTFEGMHHVFQLDLAHLETSRNALDRAVRFVCDTLRR